MKKAIIIFLLSLTLIIPTTVSACTGFTATEDNLVLMGNNEDWYDPDPYIRVHPAQQGRHGRLFIEFQWPPDNPSYFVPFTGINDQGLCFDSFLHPYKKPVNSQNKPYFNGDLMAYCLEVCTTIYEVIDIFDQYNLGFMDDFQYFIVDRNGDSAIIEGDEVIYRQGDYQVVTNFLQSDPDHGWYPCWRYDTAVDMLENMEDLTVEYFTEICDATHQEGNYPTVYSYVNDLTNNIMYLYHYYNYDKVVILDVDQEISQGFHEYYLPDLFNHGDNRPPSTPIIDGPSSGKPGRMYYYTIIASDPDGDAISYTIDFGDGTTLENGPLPPGSDFTVSHMWSKGTYTMKVKASDVYGAESEWGTLEISIPRTRFSLQSVFEFIVEHLSFFLRYLT